MAIKERVAHLEKKCDTFKFSSIPRQERVVVVAGCTSEAK